MKQIIYYETKNKEQPAQQWLGSLDKSAKAKVKAYIERVALSGALKNTKPVGEGNKNQFWPRIPSVFRGSGYHPHDLTPRRR